MELFLALASVLFLGSTCFLLMGRADRARALQEMDDSLTGARRDLMAVTKKQEESQNRYNKATSELSRFQREHKEMKQKLHSAREKASKGRASRDTNAGLESELIRSKSRVSELEAQVADQAKRVRAQRTEMQSLKTARPESAAEEVTRVAAEQGGVSEEEVQRAVSAARREGLHEARNQLGAEHGEQIQILKKAVHVERKDRALAAVEARRSLRRYQDSQRAYAITQGQLEMAHDRIFFLETGTHRRPHRPESAQLAESAVNGGSSTMFREHPEEGNEGPDEILDLNVGAEFSGEQEGENEVISDAGSSAEFLQSLVDGEPEADEAANA